MNEVLNYIVSIGGLYFIIKFICYLTARIRYEKEIYDYCSKRNIPVISQDHRLKMFFEPFWPLVLDPRKWTYKDYTGYRFHQW